MDINICESNVLKYKWYYVLLGGLYNIIKLVPDYSWHKPQFLVLSLLSVCLNVPSLFLNISAPELESANVIGEVERNFLFAMVVLSFVLSLCFLFPLDLPRLLLYVFFFLSL